MYVRRLVLALACFGAIVAGPETARAQGLTGSSSGGAAGSESINSPIPNPNRSLWQGNQYVDVTNSPRPQNLNPTGVNFSDCEQDLQLNFQLLLSGFAPGDYASVQVWAGTLDCTQDANRTGSGAGVSHPCWKVAGDYGPVNATQNYSKTISIYARDVLRYENPELPISNNNQYDATWHHSTDGETACLGQSSDAAVQISVYFLAVNSSDQALGTAYQYPLTTDLVAPPPPPSVTLNAGDELLQVNWTSPGNDPDIVGFAIFSDPPANSATSGGCNCGSSLGSGASSYVNGVFDVPGGDAACMDAESDAAEEAEAEAMDAPTESAAEAGGEAGMVSPEASVPDGSADSGAGDGSASDAAATDAGVGTDSGTSTCNSGITVGVDGGSCSSSALGSHVFSLNGTSSTPVSTDDSGTVGAEGGVSLAGGGISSINPKYEVGEIDDFTATSLTLTGLTNGDTYTVAVTSIDGSGNIGPISTQVCGKPAPTNDYWKTYKKDNGGANGCTLESGDGNGSDAPVFALGLVATAAAFIRRRTRR